MAAGRNPRISVQIVGYLIDWLNEQGHDTRALLGEVEIAPAWLRDSSQMVPLASYVRLIELAAERTHLPHLGLRLGRFGDVGSLGALGYLFIGAPSLLAAFEDFTARLHALQEGTHNRLSILGREVAIEYRITDDRIAYRRQDAEYSISAMDNLVRLYTDGALRPKEVYFEHAREGSYETYRRHFGCDVFFGQPMNTIVYDREAFNVRSVARNRLLNPIIASHLDSLIERYGARGFVDEITPMIEQGLADPRFSQRQVADRMGISVSTLARRLRREDKSFRALVLSRRLQIARRLLLADDRPIAEIALAVGYSENASFSRAFRQHFGISPERFRRDTRAHFGAPPRGE